MQFDKAFLVRIGLAAAGGFVSAWRVDYMAFKSWKSIDDAVAYDWKTAAWRWLQGTVSGVAVGLGFDVGTVMFS